MLDAAEDVGEQQPILLASAAQVSVELWQHAAAAYVLVDLRQLVQTAPAQLLAGLWQHLMVVQLWQHPAVGDLMVANPSGVVALVVGVELC